MYVNEKLKNWMPFDPFLNLPILVKSIVDLQEENKSLKKEVEKLQADKAAVLQQTLAASAVKLNGVSYVASHIRDFDSKDG